MPTLDMTVEEALAELMAVAFENCELPFVKRHADKAVEDAFLVIQAAVYKKGSGLADAQLTGLNFSQAAQLYLNRYSHCYPVG